MTITGPQQEQYATLAADMLNGGITAGAASLTLHSAALFPTAPQFRVRVDAELMLVTTVSGTTLGGLTRGIEGTTAASHADGAAVTLVLTATSLQAVATNPIGALERKGQGTFLASWFATLNGGTLHLASSPDGINWDLLSNNLLYPLASGGVHDPSITLDGNGYAWIAYDQAVQPSPVLTLIKSHDLFTWTHVVDVDVSAGLSGCIHAWAPEWVQNADGSLYRDGNGTPHLLFAANKTSNVVTGFQLYEIHPTNSDWSAWSVPVLVTASGTDFSGISQIDPFCVVRSGTFFLWYKSAGPEFIQYASSTALTSGYSNVRTGDWAGWGSGVEGPCLVNVGQDDAGNDTWRIYMDRYTSLGIYYSESSDNWATWSAKALTVHRFVPNHGTVLRLRDLPTLRSLLGVRMAYTRAPAARVHISSYGLLNNSATALPWPNNDLNDGITNGQLWASGDNTKLTARVASWYFVGALVHFPANASGFRVFDFRVNGSTFIGGNNQPANVTSGISDPKLAATQLYYLNAGDYVEVVAYQNSGSTLTLTDAQFWLVMKE